MVQVNICDLCKNKLSRLHELVLWWALDPCGRWWCLPLQCCFPRITDCDSRDPPGFHAWKQTPIGLVIPSHTVGLLAARVQRYL